MGRVLHTRWVLGMEESLLRNYVVRRKQARGCGAGLDHLVHIHSGVHPVVVCVWSNTMALEAPIEATINLLALIDELLGLLGMSKVVVPNLTKVLLSDLLFEIVT